MLESSYLALIKRDRPDLYDTVTAAIDLIEHPLTLSKDKIDPTMWSTTQLRADIDAGLAWGDIVGGPWTCWTVASLSSLGSSTVTAMEMLSLMLPGTSSIIAGQEVGKVGDCLHRHFHVCWIFAILLCCKATKKLQTDIKSVKNWIKILAIQ